MHDGSYVDDSLLSPKEGYSGEQSFSGELTWQLPDGSTRYNCGPESSYAAKRVDVPNGLHTWHRRLKASLCHLGTPKQHTCMSR